MKPRLIVLSVVAFFLLAIPVAGAPSNDPLRFVLDSRHTANPVDYLTWCGDCGGIDYTTGDPWVVNPRSNWPYGFPVVSGPSIEPGCLWDTDDSYRYSSQGNVFAAGASLSVTECRYSAVEGGGPLLLTDILIWSPSPDLDVTESWAWNQTTVSTSVTPTFDPAVHLWRYFDCIRSPRPPFGTPLVTVPDSHGGQAVTQLVSVTVSNPTSKKLLKTGGVIEAGTQFGVLQGCTSWRTP